MTAARGVRTGAPARGVVTLPGLLKSVLLRRELLRGLLLRGLLLAGGLVVACGLPGGSRAGAVPPDPEGEARIAGLVVPAGVEVQLVAHSPQFRSPVAICVDERNRIYVAEVHRFNRGTEENRNRTFLLDDDLKNQTIEDRLRSFQREVERFGGSMDYFTRYSDRIVRLEDRDGDGRAERTSVFADDFRDPLSGLGAGLIAREGVVWYTNIPDLWRLEDRDDDGIAEYRRSLVRGFGVQNAFLGHDLHGLAWGPDGKLYFSVGDRGYHVETREGRVFHGPRTGAVFRCRPDGSDFEVVYTGLRNPQELAFDDEGNLFTADNNCDKGDDSRLVFLLEGGSSGWNMAYQTLAEPYLTGPWHAEGIWHVPEPFRLPGGGPLGRENPRWSLPSAKKNPLPAWIVPPVGAIGAGPSGLVCHPGSGPLQHLSGKLLMCNYTGGGGLEAFHLEPLGAGFRLTRIEDVCKPIMATDVEFTYDGRMLLSDYVSLNWDGSSGGGRIYALRGGNDPRGGAGRHAGASGMGARSDRELAELASLSFAGMDLSRLVELLGDPDRRIRQRAQFALADRGRDATSRLADVLGDARRPRLARLHALWALGQIAATDDASWQEVRGQLSGSDDLLRSQAARVCGWAGDGGVVERLLELLDDACPPVRLRAAESLGKLGDGRAVERLFQLIRRNQDRDPWLRHAACHALFRLNALDAAVDRVDCPDASERLAAVIVLRHAADARLSRFLNDADLRVATEAARAINDLPLDSATLALARWRPADEGASGNVPEALWRRVINACFRMGDQEFVERVVELAEEPGLSEAVRGEAVAALAAWVAPGDRDRVTGFWRPLAPRDPQRYRAAVGDRLVRLPDRLPRSLRAPAIELLADLRIGVPAETLAAWLDPAAQPDTVRAAAVQLLASVPMPQAVELLNRAEQDGESRVRIAARNALAELAPNDAVVRLTGVLQNQEATVAERQAALERLGQLGGPDADRVLAECLDRLQRGEWPRAMTLELLEAARNRPALRESLARYETARAQLPPTARMDYTLAGGDAERGRWIYFNHPGAQCVRCHQINLDGGIAGPRLNGVATRHAPDARRYFLESLLEPSAKLARGYEQAVLLMEDGRVLSGTILEETATELVLRAGDGKTSRLEKGRVEERRSGQSPMPGMGEVLRPAEIRDLVEFLDALR